MKALRAIRAAAGKPVSTQKRRGMLYQAYKDALHRMTSEDFVSESPASTQSWTLLINPYPYDEYDDQTKILVDRGTINDVLDYLLEVHLSGKDYPFYWMRCVTDKVGSWWSRDHLWSYGVSYPLISRYDFDYALDPSINSEDYVFEEDESRFVQGRRSYAPRK